MCRCHELAYGVTSVNPVMGPVLNAYNITRIPGGVAAGHEPASLPHNVTSMTDRPCCAWDEQAALGAAAWP